MNARVKISCAPRPSRLTTLWKMLPMLLLAAAWMAQGGPAVAAPAVTVRERGTNDPVPGAEVVLPDGRVLAVDPRGAVLWPVDLPAGPLRLQVRAGAHEAQEVEWDGRSTLRIYLLPMPSAAEIVVEARRDSPSVSRQIIDRERIEKTPGTFDDPLRLLQALPGVAATPEYAPTAGLLSVRGALPTESRVLLDGVQIPFLYHFQQYGSVIHGRLLDEIALYPSATSAAWGDAVGGIASVTTRQADPQKVHGGVNLNAITAGAYVQAPANLPNGTRVAVSASARRSFADLGESSNDQYTLWPVFWDYLTRVDVRPRADARWSLMGVGAGDRYGRYVGDTATLDPLQRLDAPDFKFDRGFHGFILNRVSATAEGSHMSAAGFIHDRWSGGFADTAQLRVEDSVQLRHMSTLVLGDRLSLGVGGDARMAWLERTARLDRAWSELAGEAPLLARGVAVSDRRAAIVGGIWVEPRFQLGALRVQPGMRLQGDSDTGGLSPEPRLSSVLRTAEDQQLRFAIARTSQAPGLDATAPAGGDPSLGLVRAEQAALGYDIAVAGRWELGAELWGSRVHDALDLDPGQAADVVDGQAGGVELTSRYRLRERFFTWASLALGRSFRGGAPADFDQPYALNLVASWDFARSWNVGLRYRRSSGLPLSPVLGAVYDGDVDEYTPVYGPENSARLPDYQKVDLHLERSWALRRWTLVVYGEAWWVPAQNNAMYTVYSYDYAQSATVAGPGFVPLLGARVEL